MAQKATQIAVDEITRKRQQQVAVSAYLAALEQTTQHRGTRGVNPERLRTRLDAVETELEAATSVERVLLLQEQMDLQARLEAHLDDDGPDALVELRDTFIEIGAEWAERKGISYAALRAVNVPAAVLRAAGIFRNGG